MMNLISRAWMMAKHYTAVLRRETFRRRLRLPMCDWGWLGTWILMINEMSFEFGRFELQEHTK
jgi:hypothetical protein